MAVTLKGQWARPVDCTCDDKACPHRKSSRMCTGGATLEVYSDSNVALTRGEHWLCQRCFKHAEIRDIHSRDPERRKKTMKKEYVIWVDSGDEDGTDPLPLDQTYMATSEQDAIEQAVKRGDLDRATAVNYAQAQLTRGTSSARKSRPKSRSWSAKPRKSRTTEYGKDKTLGSGNWAEPLVKSRKPAIGRRKTVRTKVGRLVSRKSQKAVKRALFRSQVKKYPCPFCAREDFLGEKGLKKHIAKFHEAGVRSKRGYRTARDSQEWYILLFDTRGAFSTFVTVTGDKAMALRKAAQYRAKGYAKVEVTKHHPSASRGSKGRWDRRVAKHNRGARKWGMGAYRRDA